jgi:hypothetical protein
MMKRYKELLTYIKSAVVRNYSERSINSILDYISTSRRVRIVFFLSLRVKKIIIKFCLDILLDGLVAELLRDHIASIEGDKERPPMV